MSEAMMRKGILLGQQYARAVGVTCSEPMPVQGSRTPAILDVRLFRDFCNDKAEICDDPIGRTSMCANVDGLGNLEPDPTVPAYQRALAYAMTLGEPLVWDEVQKKPIPPAAFEAEILRRGQRPRMDTGFSPPDAVFCALCSQWTGRGAGSEETGIAKCGGDFRTDCPSGWKRFLARVTTYYGSTVIIAPFEEK